MGKIYYVMGKSSSGKDTVYKKLLERHPGFRTIVPYTTRPIREGERDGVEYFFVDDERLREMQEAEQVIEVSYRALREYFGAEKLIPVYIEVEDGLRLARAVERERRQAEPKYSELCRRFLADEEDFSEEKLRRAGIMRRFENRDLDACLEEIEDYIRSSERV